MAPWPATAAGAAGPGRVGERLQQYAKRQQRLVSLVRRSRPAARRPSRRRFATAKAPEDFLVLLDAERERLAAEDAQAQAEIELSRASCAIYKALGGGWQPSA